MLIEILKLQESENGSGFGEVIYDMSVGYDSRESKPNGTGLHPRNEGCLAVWTLPKQIPGSIQSVPRS
ncbi:MAG: hypothetical protein Ct9H90mP9_0390 [Pseudomonadota bacterium]|nr:MAG: hypothetical protein Ct9H90mP9_0390 [Pseudomonadota bacterium]